MKTSMEILITNDDGIQSDGIKALVEAMRPYGNLTIVAPKYHQSGMSMAVSMGFKPIAAKEILRKEGERWIYVDGTPASCIKYGLDIALEGKKPDVVISGINHGSNAATAALYSGTLGAAKEAAIAGIPAIGVSLDHMALSADFSTVVKMFPALFEKVMANLSGKKGVYYNINYPYLKENEIKGIRVAHQGSIRWDDEFVKFDPGIYDKLGVTPQMLGIPKLPEVEEGETVYMMAGQNMNNDNDQCADNILNEKGYITIVVHNTNTTDYEEIERLRTLGFNQDF
ncbi:MAG: 5'/3'-nucleotidase SurE [Bacteroidales bacterium]|nr:5'/3'-nucleotidase SurE [Bacteroidales bacterium]